MTTWVVHLMLAIRLRFWILHGLSILSMMLPIKYMEVEIIACPSNKKDEEANFFFASSFFVKSSSRHVDELK